MPSAKHPSRRTTYYRPRQAAWILGVSPSAIPRAIRLGTLHAERRNGQLVIPDYVLAHLLDRRDDGTPGDHRGGAR